jgi:hypothetical protein
VITFDNGAETGIIAVSMTAAAAGTQGIQIYPPLASTASVAVDALYGGQAAYRTEIMAAYPLQEDGNDRTSNGYNLTENGTPTYTTGTLGAHAVLNGSDQYFEADVSPISDRPATFFAVFIQAIAAQSGEENVVYYGDASDGADWWVIEMNTQNLRTWDRMDGADYASSGTDYADESVHTMAGTFREANGGGDHEVELYIDGSSDGTNLSGNPATTPTLFDRVDIGRRGDSSPGSYWAGNISWVFLLAEDTSADWVAYMHSQIAGQASVFGTWSWVSTTSPVEGTTCVDYGMVAIMALGGRDGTLRKRN